VGADELDFASATAPAAASARAEERTREDELDFASPPIRPRYEKACEVGPVSARPALKSEMRLASAGALVVTRSDPRRGRGRAPRRSADHAGGRGRGGRRRRRPAFARTPRS